MNWVKPPKGETVMNNHLLDGPGLQAELMRLRHRLQALEARAAQLSGSHQSNDSPDAPCAPPSTGSGANRAPGCGETGGHPHSGVAPWQFALGIVVVAVIVLLPLVRLMTLADLPTEIAIWLSWLSAPATWAVY